MGVVCLGSICSIFQRYWCLQRYWWDLEVYAVNWSKSDDLKKWVFFRKGPGLGKLPIRV